MSNISFSINNPCKVRITYTIIIDYGVATDFEQAVFHTSYQEFITASKPFFDATALSRFSEMATADSKAHALHYKVGFPALPHIESLNGQIPGLEENTGNLVEFESFDLRLLESSILDQREHRLSLTFITPELDCLHSFGDYLLLRNVSGSSPTFLLQIKKGVNLILSEGMGVEEK